MLNGFQSDLSSISSEIQTLQEQSIAMKVKLKNRQAVRGELSEFVEEMASGIGAVAMRLRMHWRLASLSLPVVGLGLPPRLGWA